MDAARAFGIAAALTISACGPSAGSRCFAHADCGGTGLLCSNARHGGAPWRSPPAPAPSCASAGDCEGNARCVEGRCVSAGKCEQARP